MSHRHESPNRKLDEQFVHFLVKIFRDLVIFSLGCVGFIHELLREGNERPQILIVSAAALGLPFIIRGDEKRQEGKANDNKH